MIKEVKRCYEKVINNAHKSPLDITSLDGVRPVMDIMIHNL